MCKYTCAHSHKTLTPAWFVTDDSNQRSPGGGVYEYLAAPGFDPNDYTSFRRVSDRGRVCGDGGGSGHGGGFRGEDARVAVASNTVRQYQQIRRLSSREESMKDSQSPINSPRRRRAGGEASQARDRGVGLSALGGGDAGGEMRASAKSVTEGAVQGRVDPRLHRSNSPSRIRQVRGVCMHSVSGVLFPSRSKAQTYGHVYHRTLGQGRLSKDPISGVIRPVSSIRDLKSKTFQGIYAYPCTRTCTRACVSIANSSRCTSAPLHPHSLARDHSLPLSRARPHAHNTECSIHCQGTDSADCLRLVRCCQGDDHRNTTPAYLHGASLCMFVCVCIHACSRPCGGIK